MFLLKQLAKVVGVLVAVDLGMFVFGIDVNTAKFGVVSALVSFGSVFVFLYPYMEQIGWFNSMMTPGLDTSSPPPPIVWKFLGYVCFTIALLCLIFWH